LSSVLVTGAAGFIGAHAVRALAARGLAVTALVRPGSPRPRLAELPAGTSLVEADLDDTAAVARALAACRPEKLLHLAWYAHPVDYLTSRRNLQSLQATASLVAAAVDAGCRRIVGVGTCLELGPSDAPASEGTAAGPDTLYAACKHAARLVAEQLAVGRATFAWARLFHLHGPGEDPARLIAMVAARLRRGEPVELSPGGQWRDYLRVEDMAEALGLLTEATVEGTIHVCSGRPATLRATLEAVARAVGRPDLLRFGALPYRPGDRLAILGDPAALRRLGWIPRLTSPEDAFAYLAP
jgi:nucleoside-diphosphate-sugar epimerase